MKLKMNKTIFWWLSPIYLNFIFELVFCDFRAERWINFSENHVFLLILLVFFNLHSVFKKKAFLRLFHFGFVLTCSLESLYFYWFGTNFSASAIFVLLETNLAEAKEFLSFYFNPVSLVLMLLNVAWIVAYQFRKKIKLPIVIKWANQWLALPLFILLLGVFKLSHLIDQNFPYALIRGVIVYNYEQFQLKDLPLDKKESFLTNVKHLGEDQATYIIVIGESASRNHLGVYGYQRETTPFLSDIKNELTIYNDVISNSAYTIGSLRNALTYNHFKKEEEASLVQLMNQAEFTSFWISNQRPVGPYESLVTKISKASDFVHFTNTAIAGGVTPYDEVLLSHFEKALQQKDNKKFIVLHLLGSHHEYKNRYPKEFELFEDTPKPFLGTNQADRQRRNEYDNSIAYTDYILQQVFELLQKQEGEKSMLYFSDHGEEVYQTRDFAGHYEENPSPAMFEIPFLFWTSEDYFKNHELIIDTERGFMLNYFFDTYADFSKIRFEELRKERSLFSKKLESKNRQLNSGAYYEKLTR